VVDHDGLNLPPAALPTGRLRHAYGAGPFARLRMPWLPGEPGLYLWERDELIVYVGQTRTPLRDRLGPRGYARISNYNTFQRERGRSNGGQQTNCRVNALANQALVEGRAVAIWYRVLPVEVVRHDEAAWMRTYGAPEWNRRIELASG